MDIKQAIKAHALREAPRECCGLILRGNDGELVIEETPNTAADPLQFFAIPVVEFLAAKNAGRLVAYYHSHPTGTGDASDPDKAAAEEIGLPVFTYGIQDDRLTRYRPKGWRAPLEGRKFAPLIFDCVTLVWDYFTELGNRLPEFDHAETDDVNGTAIDVRRLIAEAGAEIVAVPRAGDVIVMITGASKRPNHLGILMSDGTILHQTRAESRRDVFAGYWQRKMCYAVRVPRPEAPIVETKPQGEALKAAGGTV